MLELYQAEWCPSSRRVRQRLTELGLDFVARQVPAEKAARMRLLLETGSDSIPVLIDGTTTVSGADMIVAYLSEHFEERPDAREHRAQASRMRARELEEWLCCLRPAAREEVMS